jgi:hypothetical protein
MTDLHINDPLSMRDLSAFTSLAHRADADGAMRLQVASDVLAATVAPLFPHGLGDSTPLVLAMRMLRLDDHEQDGFDEAVPLSNLLDRFARDENGTTLPVPPNSVLVSWTGIAPPRGGWSEYDTISVGRLHETAESGIAEISTGASEGSGGTRGQGSAFPRVVTSDDGRAGNRDARRIGLRRRCAALHSTSGSR